MDLLKRHLLVIGIGLAAGAAWGVPNAGIFLGDHGAKTAAVALIFLMSGATMPLAHLGEDLRKWRCHAAIQGFSLGLIPLAIWYTSGWVAEGAVRYGIFIVAVVPTTISSCVVLTSAAGGRTPCALINAVGGNLLGIFLSPFLLALMIGGEGGLPGSRIVRTILHLCAIVVLPFAVGKLLARLFPRLAGRVKRIQSFAAQLAILLIMFCAFAASRDRLRENASEMWVAFVYLAVAHVVFVAALTALVAAMRLAARDATAVVMCGSQKTLALGIPLCEAFFRGGDVPTGVLIVPLVFYHVFQLAAAGLLVAYWSKRNRDGDAP